MIDMWATKHKQQVLGIKAQYISDWKIRHVVLGFKDFPQSHTGENIKEALDSFLLTHFEIKPEQVII
jgi:hypothetical protein